MRMVGNIAAQVAQPVIQAVLENPSDSGGEAVAFNSPDMHALDEILMFGPFTLHVSRRLLMNGDTRVAIGGRALDLLIALTRSPQQVVNSRDLMKIVWPDVLVEEANLRVHVAGLRKALGDGADGARYIINVSGRGYSFVADIHRPRIVAQPEVREEHSAAPRHLPMCSRSMIGRTQTVAMLSALVQARGFVNIVGPGGIGKTTVAIAVAHALRPVFGDDGICFVDLGSLTEVSDVPMAIASALGCILQGPDPEACIHAFLAEKRFLIVLDNCEHVIGAIAEITGRIFISRPSTNLLTTSREVLRVQGENVHLLTPLDSPLSPMPSAEQALASPAVQLFMERAAASGYATELNDLEAPIVADICRRLDGVALAIELAASRVAIYGIQGIANLLATGDALQMEGRRNAPPRHRTLHGMLDWSYRLLSEDEQRVLARLSVFVGPFCLEAAQAVASDLENEGTVFAGILVSLWHKSLIAIAPTGDPTRYRLLDTTRVYAAARLEETGEKAAAEMRHAQYYAGFLKASAIRTSVADGRKVALHGPNMPNVRKALAWCFSAPGNIDTGVDLVVSAAPLFLGLSQFLECQRWCQQALGAMPQDDRAAERELELQTALAASAMYVWDYGHDVRATIDRGLELSNMLGKPRRHFYLLGDLSVFLTRRGDFAGALAAAKEAADVAKKEGGAVERVIAQWLLGASYHLSGDQEAALRHGQLGFTLASELAPGQINLFYETRARFALARSLWLCGYPDQAGEVARQTIGDVAQYNHHHSYGLALIYSIPVFLWSGDLDSAEEPVDLAIAHAVKYSLAPFLAIGMALKGEFLIEKGEVGSGVELLRLALEKMQSGQYNIVNSHASRALAEGLANSGRIDEALAVIDTALSDAHRTGETIWTADLLRTRGDLLMRQAEPDPAEAEKALCEAIRCAQEQSALGWELRAAISLARLWRGQEHRQKAETLLGNVYGRFSEGFKTRDLVAARMLLDELRCS